MPRTGLNDIAAFLAVARGRSFTRAAAQLGISQSALSQTIRSLETRLGLRLAHPHHAQRRTDTGRQTSAPSRGSPVRGN